MSLALTLKFAVVTDVHFAAPILRKTQKTPSQFCQIEILWKKISLPTHSVKGCRSFAAKCSTHAHGPDHPLTEPWQSFPAGAPRFLSGNSWPQPMAESSRLRRKLVEPPLCILGACKVPLVNLDGTWLPRGCSFDPMHGTPGNIHSCSKEAARLSHRTYAPIKPVYFHIYFATGVENLWQVVIDGTVLLWR